MSNKKIVVGNWKMNPATADEAKRIARKTRRAALALMHTEAVVCPPFPFISAASSRNKSPHYHLGAQTASFEVGGAHTGEVAANVLKDLGVEYVIVGHSETRRGESSIGDTDEMVSKRAKAVLESGMKVVLCVGEKIRDESGAHFEFVKEQMSKSLADVPKSRSGDVILAYEPIWAIGAQEAMKPEDINEMTIFVKKIFSDIFGAESAQKVQVLYGGSVNFRNAADIMKIGQVDGLLVGRESVNMAGFVELLKAVDEVK